MEEYFRDPVFKNEENHSKVIIPEEKDKIVDKLTNCREYSFRLGYKDVSNLKLVRHNLRK